MPFVSAKEMLIKASKEKYAVGAFNITSIVQLEAILEAATEMKAPVIIQTSVTPAKFLQPEVIVAVCSVLAQSADIPVCLHLDHCTEVSFCKKCADLGFTNIMFDGSRLNYEENIKLTREVSDYCHQKGDITVEGELGTVAGVEDQIKVTEDEAQLCNPDIAVDFVKRSGIDLFGPAIGTAHGVYKTENPVIDTERLFKIHKKLNYPEIQTPLVIHGGTGLKEEVVRELVKNGGAKYNVSTNLKHILIDSIYEYISTHPDEYDPVRIDSHMKKATKERIKYWIDLLGSNGMAK
ncbi:MAG: class II fructose-bisphosphate aldolase family protein [Parabacteroides sp.]|nr:class II fructose-bisphosphate aldolase family protein [Parabacteroides sp.]MDK2978022.1 tagatose 1,6-diphosphate aldolase GatY/KbaY [Bacteroidales bacterium]